MYVVNDNEDQSYLVAYEAKTGKELWRVARDEKSNWSTPFIWENGQRTELVTVGSKRVRSYDLPKHLAYRKLDAFIPAYSAASHPDQHISDIYADWFTQLFGIPIPPAARYPVLSIPDRWMDYARGQFAAWEFGGTGGATPNVVFLNAYSKSVERSWPLERVIELIRTMQRDAAWRDAGFIVNVTLPPRFRPAWFLAISVACLVVLLGWRDGLLALSVAGSLIASSSSASSARRAGNAGVPSPAVLSDRRAMPSSNDGLSG